MPKRARIVFNGQFHAIDPEHADQVVAQIIELSKKSTGGGSSVITLGDETDNVRLIWTLGAPITVEVWDADDDDDD